ncbi:hypothetical protein KRX57_01850 [Weeksellaceae bacterium TAE3-ERU29]|nr:hypothetical protein [Weeksellaceae bacterium TAE3-ERU29]
MENIKLSKRQYSFTPRNLKDIELVDTFFKALGVEFEEILEDERLEDWQNKLIEIGIKQIESGNIVSHDEVMAKAQKLCSE